MFDVTITSSGEQQKLDSSRITSIFRQQHYCALLKKACINRKTAQKSMELLQFEAVPGLNAGPKVVSAFVCISREDNVSVVVERKYGSTRCPESLEERCPLGFQDVEHAVHWTLGRKASDRVASSVE